MNWAAIRTVLGKELRETLRDRRTLLVMIVVPVLLYPAMFILMEQVTLFGQRNIRAEGVRVAVIAAPSPAAEFLTRDSAISMVEVAGPAREALRQGRIDAVLTFPAEWSETATNDVELLFDGTRERSGHARLLVEERLRVLIDTLRLERLGRYGLPAEYATPLAVEQTSVATPEAVGGYMLGRFLPLLLIMMTVLGAFYPSIDLAAGEKERGTLEPLLTVPVHADNLVIGKFAAAALMGLTAATLNLASMLLTFQTGVLQFAAFARVQFHMPLQAVLVIFVVLALLAILFSALFLGIAVRSHSFKEAQNALTPVYMAAFVPALLPLIPGLGFGPGMALIPVAGIAFLFRDLMGGVAAPGPAVIAVMATVAYTALALGFAARSFGREEVLFGSGTAPSRKLGARRGVPTPAAALALVALVAVLFFYIARPLVMASGENGHALAQWLLLAAPALLFVAVGRYDARRTFALRRPAARTIVAALAIMLGGIPIGWLIAWLQNFVLTIPVEFLAEMQRLVAAEDAVTMVRLVLVLAVTPAICEELVFRGILLQAFSTRMAAAGTIILSAVVFGAFHLSSVTAIRFLPTAWLGLLLGLVVWRTRSIVPAMVMHFVNNAAVIVIISSPAMHKWLSPGDGQLPWLVVGIAPFLLAAGWWALPPREESPHVETVVDSEPQALARG